MNIIRQIRATQRRLWLNRWLRCFFWSLAAAGALFAVAVTVQRLWDLPLSLGWSGVALIVGVLLGSGAWLWTTREGPEIAAATLDEAAGLRERISTGRFCMEQADPFARAVVADAERVSSALTVHQHIKLRVPPSLGWALCSIVVAGLMFLVPVGAAKRAETVESVASNDLRETRVAVKRELDAVKKAAENSAALGDLKADLERLDKDLETKFEKTGDLRHEAVKKIDALADALKQKKSSPDQESFQALRQNLRSLRVPNSEDAPTEKMAKALRRGDFKTAREEIEKAKEQLASMKSEEDKQAVEKLSKQLDELSKQLDSLAKDEKLAEKLEKAGVKKDDVEKALESLKKNDLEQLQKQLEQSGMNPQQAQKLAQQLQQQRQAGSVAQKLAQSMKAGAKCNNPGQAGEAMAGLSQAAEQLSDLEKLDQEMAEMNSTLQALNDAKKQLGNQGSQGGQAGSEPGNGGMGPNPNQGKGGLAPEEPASVAFKVERGKVHTGKGAIIGQFHVEGEQVKGEATAKLAEVAEAAERDASDRIQRDRIPRQYHKAVKSYFSTVRRALESTKGGQPGASDSANHGEPKAPQGGSSVSIRPKDE